MQDVWNAFRKVNLLGPPHLLIESYMWLSLTAMQFQGFSLRVDGFQSVKQAKTLSESVIMTSIADGVDVVLWKLPAEVDEAIRFHCCMILEYLSDPAPNNFLYTLRE